MAYLSAEEIIILNSQIQDHFGTEPSLRDANALDYIVKSAGQEVFGQVLYGSIEELVAFYIMKVVKKHVFNDANKRTAFQSGALCLDKNGYRFKHDCHITIAKQIVIIAQADGEDDSLWRNTVEIVRSSIIRR